ncbi:hypothetical protein WA026_008784 [Henosepilachna vigintioctopunctata]|uniref:Uncharacterized protein n=1 Tax=Henosepilachna vigintioctopunctata TaxID=420089 RepID=A0AAW1VB77_9CUCU
MQVEKNLSQAQSWGRKARNRNSRFNPQWIKEFPGSSVINSTHLGEYTKELTGLLEGVYRRTISISCLFTCKSSLLNCYE